MSKKIITVRPENGWLFVKVVSIDPGNSNDKGRIISLSEEEDNKLFPYKVVEVVDAGPGVWSSGSDTRLELPYKEGDQLLYLINSGTPLQFNGKAAFPSGPKISEYWLVRYSECLGTIHGSF